LKRSRKQAFVAASVSKLDPDKQRSFAMEVVTQLRARQFETYWAGGCVRDRLLGKVPKDYDVATTARPDEVREVFGRKRTRPVGAAFGVVLVSGPRGAGPIEIATFRKDSTYSDGRHPDSVEFSTPQLDAQRRDFTVNGLFYDPVEDQVIDYVGGQDDLARGILRAIGDPRARFSEDKLRLLRAVRFAATLDFQLDPETRGALEDMAAQVSQVSAERIADEMRRTLMHSNRVRGVVLLHEVGLLEVTLPELATVNRADALTARGRSADEAWVETLEVLQVLSEPTFPLALAALLHAFVDNDSGQQACRRWKLSNAETSRVEWLVAHQSALVHASRVAWPRLQRLLISEGIDELLALHEAIARAGGRALDDVEYCRERLRMPRNELDPSPLLTGDDLIRHGVPRGREYQKLLTAVRDAQLESKITTKAEAIELVDRLRAEKGQDDSTD
jgi:poly(A) polymerase